MTVTDTENGKLFVLSEGDDAYDIIGDYVERYWERHYYGAVLICMYISFDGEIWYGGIEYAEPTEYCTGVVFNNDWWEGEKHIKLLGIKSVRDFDDFYGGIYEEEVDTK